MTLITFRLEKQVPNYIAKEIPRRIQILIKKNADLSGSADVAVEICATA